jgi:dihydrofolate reductase
MIIGIWAEDEQGLIGQDGHLPWKLPAELAHFKATTMNQAILMGRKTFDSMHKRVLPGRTSIVLTRESTYQAENDKVLVLHSKEEVLDWYKNQDKILFVIGGAEILSLFELEFDALYQTIVHSEFVGDAYFPKTFDLSNFQLESENFHEQDEKNAHAFTIKKYKKVN